MTYDYSNTIQTYDNINASQNNVLWVIVVVLIVAIPLLFLYMIGSAAYRTWKRRSLAGTALRCIGFISICFASVTYLIGLVLLIPDGQEMYGLCKINTPHEPVEKNTYFEISYIPLKTTCRVENGGTYDIDENPNSSPRNISPYINTTVAVAAAVAVAAFVAVRRFPDEAPAPCETEELDPEEGVAP